MELIHIMIIIFNKQIGQGLSCWSKTLMDHQQLVKQKSTTFKTLWPACTATSSKDRWIGGLFYWPNYCRETQLQKHLNINQNTVHQLLVSKDMDVIMLYGSKLEYYVTECDLHPTLIFPCKARSLEEPTIRVARGIEEPYIRVVSTKGLRSGCLQPFLQISN